MKKKLALLSFLPVIGFLHTPVSIANARGAGPSYTIVDWFPYGWVEDDRPQGMLVEIAKAVDHAIGGENAIRIAPVPRVLRSIRNGEYDFSIIYRGEKLGSQVDHLLDVGCVRTVAMSMEMRPVKALQDMKGMRIAFSGDGYFHERFLPGLDAVGVEVANTDVMFRMALRGRLDAFVIDDAVLQGYANNLYPKYKIPESEWSRFAEPYYLESLRLAVSTSFSPRHQGAKNRIRALRGNNKFLSDLQEIYDKYQLPAGTACLHLSNGTLGGN